MARHASYDREDVLAKAQALFWRKGYHGTSLKDLEAALDMRPGSIYAAFGSKEALFGEALKDYGRQAMAQFQKAQQTAASPLAGLANHVRAFACIDPDTAPSRACMLVKTLLEMPDDDPVLRLQTEEMMQKMEAEFAGAFRAAQLNGELPASANPERLASRLQAAIFGLRAYAQRSDAQSRIIQMTEDIALDIESLSQREFA